MSAYACVVFASGPTLLLVRSLVAVDLLGSLALRLCGLARDADAPGAAAEVAALAEAAAAGGQGRSATGAVVPLVVCACRGPRVGFGPRPGG
jgi:hypothetical protein